MVGYGTDDVDYWTVKNRSVSHDIKPLRLVFVASRFLRLDHPATFQSPMLRRMMVGNGLMIMDDVGPTAGVTAGVRAIKSHFDCHYHPHHAKAASRMPKRRVHKFENLFGLRKT